MQLIKQPVFRRTFVAAASVLVLGLLAWWGLIAISNRVFFGVDSEADLKKVATSGQPIVHAVYSYRDANGLWPQRLNDLVPAFLPSAPGPQWGFSWTHFGGNRVHTHSPGGALRIEFCFTDQTNHGWTAGNRDAEISLGIAAPRNSPPNLADAAIASARIHELHRRALREPAELTHRQALVTDLARLKRWQEALDICNQAIVDFPSDWWPQFAAAEILVHTGGVPAADAQLVKWTDTKPNFVRYWVLAQFREKHQMPAEAISALEKAAAFPIKEDEGISFVPAYMALSAARSAYQQGRHDLVLSVCDRWKSLSIYQREPSYRAFQSASFLALGNFTAAKTAIDELIPIANAQAIWAGGLTGLKQAVDARNQGFVYSGGGIWPALDYSVEYE